MGKLTAIAIKKAAGDCVLHDGEGLRLQLRKGKGSWIFRYQINGRSRDMGLGSLSDVSLADAREARNEARRLVRSGQDPIEAARASNGAGKPIKHTFEKAAESYISEREASWRNAKTPYRWRARLRDYAFPLIGKKDVAEITPEDVFKCLSPIWYTKTETATKTRGYIEAVLSWAGAKGYRDRERMNPAQWKDNLEHLLTARSGFEIVEHHPAMPYADLPEFMVKLRERDAMSARALELVILTACRSGDVRLAPWSEFDLEKAVWTIPATRQLKSRRPHRVPLSAQAIALLNGLPRFNTSLIFPGNRDAKPLSDMAFNMLLRRMGVDEFHTHGFRSSFKDWCVEQTSFPHAISEMALAHDIGTGTEKAYRRSDFFEKRRALMQHWADYLDTKS